MKEILQDVGTCHQNIGDGKMADNSTPISEKNQRKSVRKALLGTAIFISLNVRSKCALTIDLSTGGLSLTLPAALEVGQACAISFDVPDKKVNQRALINGTVVSCVEKGAEGYRVGIHFVHADPASKQLIKAAVDNYLESIT
jgi:hypothetical protein